jgi:hypothetical protein
MIAWCRGRPRTASRGLEEAGTSWTGRMQLGRLESIAVGTRGPLAMAARRQMRTLVRSFLPVGGLPFSGPPKAPQRP